MSEKAGEKVSRKRPVTLYIAIFVISAAISGVLGVFGLVSFPLLPFMSSFYPATGMWVCFGIWFGMWGALGGGYVGGLIGGLLSGTPLALAAVMYINGFAEAGVPMLAYRIFKFDPELKTKRDWTGHIVFNCLLAPFASAWTGVPWLLWFGIFPIEVFWIAWAGWFLSDVIVAAIISTIALKVFSGYLKKTALFIPGYWS